MKKFRELEVWNASKRFVFDPGRRVFANIASRGRVPLMWCQGHNWGDALSPVLVGLLSGKTVAHQDGLHHNRYLAIGSVLGGANERAEVWGSGFIRAGEATIGRPRKIHAVRGPLSRDALMSQGIDCPEVFGDPALLLPRFFNPVIEKQFSVGIIPHYIDKAHPWLNMQASSPLVRIIDIESGIQDFVKAVKSCEKILSSSLHGLICADSYGVPNAWIRLSDNVIGGEFKFEDYYRAIGAHPAIPMNVDATTTLNSLTQRTVKHELDIDLRKLVLACPFLRPDLRAEILDSSGGPCGLPAIFSDSYLFSHI